MPAQTTSSYVLVSNNSELLNARILATPAENSQFSISLGAGVLNVAPSGQLAGLHNLSTPGWVAWDGSSSFVGRAITSNGTVDITHPDAMNANTNVEFADNSTFQRINVYENGTLVGSRTNLNWMAGDNITINIVDDDDDDITRLNITSNGSSQGGTVISVDFASSTGLTIGGTNPITNRGIATIDLPVGVADNIGDVLTLSATSPSYELSWDPLNADGTISKITLLSGNNSLGNPWYTITNGVITTNQVADIELNEWSSIPANSSVSVLDNSLENVLALKFSAKTSQTNESEIRLGDPDTFPLLCSAATLDGVPPDTDYLVCRISSSLPTYFVGMDGGFPAMPAGTQAYGSTGSILVGNGGEGVLKAPSFSALASPTGEQDQVFYLKLDGTSRTVYWDFSSQIVTDTVSLNYTAVEPTGGGEPIVLGNGTCFVSNNNIKEDSVIHVQPIGIYNGVRPSIGPVSVKINHTTGEGQLPVGFIIYGNSHNDNGKTVCYSIDKY